MRVFLFIIYIILTPILRGQSSDGSTKLCENDSIQYVPFPEMHEKGLIFSPQYQLSAAGNQWGAEIYLMQGGCHLGCIGSGIGLGYHYNFERNKQRFTLSYAKASSMLFMGLDGRLDLNLNRWNDRSSISLKPGVGLAIMHMYFHYGYDFQFNDENKDFTRHSLSIHTYLPFVRIANRR